LITEWRRRIARHASLRTLNQHLVDRPSIINSQTVAGA
jgi:hypothetical protein